MKFRKIGSQVEKNTVKKLPFVGRRRWQKGELCFGDHEKKGDDSCWCGWLVVTGREVCLIKIVDGLFCQ